MFSLSACALSGCSGFFPRSKDMPELRLTEDAKLAVAMNVNGFLSLFWPVQGVLWLLLCAGWD